MISTNAIRKIRRFPYLLPLINRKVPATNSKANARFSNTMLQSLTSMFSPILGYPMLSISITNSKPDIKCWKIFSIDKIVKIPTELKIFWVTFYLSNVIQPNELPYWLLVGRGCVSLTEFVPAKNQFLLAVRILPVSVHALLGSVGVSDCHSFANTIIKNLRERSPRQSEYQEL